jgi:hypothetical protein
MSPWKNIGKLSAKEEAKREAEFQARLLAEIGGQAQPKSAAQTPVPAAKASTDGVSVSVTENGQTMIYASLDTVPLALRQKILNAWLAKPPA